MGKIIAVANQKGGVGKTTTAVNIVIGLAVKGKKVLLVDADAQGNLSSSLGVDFPDELERTLSDLIFDVMNDEKLNVGEVIMHHNENVDFIPSNISLASVETLLVNVMSREMVLKQILGDIKQEYDYIIIDSQPSLGLLTINNLVAADSVLIPVQAHFYSTKGMQELFKIIGKTRRNLNPDLQIEGVLFTFNQNTNHNKKVISAVIEAYGNSTIPFFESSIPQSIRVAEASEKASSIYKYNSEGKVSRAYADVVREVLSHE